MLQPYTARNSICTQKVFIALDEKKLDYETKTINLFASEQYSPEYLKINPSASAGNAARLEELLQRLSAERRHHLGV